MSFRNKILRNKWLMAGLSKRGYSLQKYPDDDENRCTFESQLNSNFSTDIFFSINDKLHFQCSIGIQSQTVTDYFHRLSLYLDDPIWPSSDSPTRILSAELSWLYWNTHPEIARNDNKYGFKSEEINDFFEDFDTVGQTFFSIIASPLTLAHLLSNILAYPNNFSFGGLISVDPIIYSAILYFECGERTKATELLDKTLERYAYEVPGASWQVRRLRQLQERRRILLENHEHLSLNDG